MSTESNDKNSDKNSIPPGMKLGRKWGYIIAGILAVAAPAWTGALNSMNSGVVADQAASRSTEAIEKASLSYELLAQKMEMENKVVLDRIDRQDKRVDKLEEKLDRLLMRAARNGSFNRREVEEIKAMADAEAPESDPKPVSQIELPKNLDLAYKTRQAEKKAAGL